MGLASKLAATQQGQRPGQLQAGGGQYQAYPGSQPQYQQYPGQLGPQPQYPNQRTHSPQPPNIPPRPMGYSPSPMPAGSPYPQGQPPNPPYPQPPQNYGAPQQHGGLWPGQPQGYGQQGGYPPQGAGAGGVPNPHLTAAYRQVLQNVIQEKNLSRMFPPGSPYVEQVASKVNNQVNQFCERWRVPREIGQDIVKLALFDIILYIDDSGSMAFEEDGARISDLKLILARVAYAGSLFDANGIEVRFMNSDIQGNRITSEQDVENLVSRVQFKGLTPMGTQLKNKVIEPLVMQPARAGKLTKPVLVISITDGQPAGEPHNALFDAVKDAVSELSQMPRYGQGALSFQFAQVGNDLKAREFLSKLDNDPSIGHLVDCTSNYEVEQDEMSRANPPVDLTKELWLAKMLLGAIDSSYDTKDEQGNRLSGGQGQYGAPQGYPPQGQAPYPGNQPYGQPPPGYPQGQGGYPGQQPPYGQQPGYPPRPPQGGYPQQGGYGGQNPPYR